MVFREKFKLSRQRFVHWTIELPCQFKTKYLPIKLVSARSENQLHFKKKSFSHGYRIKTIILALKISTKFLKIIIELTVELRLPYTRIVH